MTKKLLFVVSILCALTFAVMAADVSGKWTYEQQGRNGATTSTLTLKADGSTLTGTLEGGRGGPSEITDGKVDGNTVTFSTKREFNGNSMTTTYKGTVDGDTMKLDITRPGMNGGEARTTSVTAKRSTT